ncbi:MAG: bamA [Candidatus Krumholzibacteriota bacterium]|nr:bamA [Candidatus Krumholzibacteriota bacterium]
MGYPMSHPRPPRLCLVLTLVSVAVAFAGHARAETPRTAAAYKNWSVSSVAVTGVDKDTASDVKKGLALALTSGFLGRTSPVFFPQTLDEDLRRVKLYFARRGYPYARVSPRFDPKPAKQSVGITFVIDRGPPVRIASTALSGVPEDLAHDAAKAVTIEPDSVLVDSEVEKSAATLTKLLQNNGYARASVKPRIAWQDTTRVDVVFEAEPGMLNYFGDIFISGADNDLLPLVKKTVVARRGDRFDPKALKDSEENLRVLGLFRQIRLDLQDAADDTLDVAADLSMREPRTVETGVRYWSDEKLDAAFQWTHRNLFKKGRGGSLTASASSYLQRLEFTAWWPAVIVARDRLMTTLGSRRENEDSYEQTTTGVDLALVYDRSYQTRVRWEAAISNVAVTSKTEEPDVITGQDGLLAALGWVWENDRTNDPIVPTRGGLTRISIEWAPASSLTDYHYLLVEPEISAYLGIPRTRGGVFATRVCIGLGDPLGNSADLLPGKRFYSGGSNSMRGFQRRKLGPLDADGAPLGGEAKLEGSLELRYPVFRKIQGTTFVDAGQVWPTLDEVVLDDVEFAVGQGMWFTTPIGPIRGDLAYRLTYYETSQPRWVFHFSVGPAF